MTEAMQNPADHDVTNGAKIVSSGMLGQYTPQPIASQSDREHEFLGTMKAAGCEPIDGMVIADDQLHRIDIVGDHKGSKNGAYQLAYEVDGFAFGWFQNWKSGNGVIPWHSCAVTQLTGEQRTRIKAKRVAQKSAQDKAREERQTEAATKAQGIWASCSKDGTSEYLERKKITLHTARLSKGDLVIPIKNNSKVVSLQFIKEDGSKKFLAGGRVAGGYCSIIYANDDLSTVIICEGFATGASIREATGLPVMIAFSAGNLKAVAETVRRQFSTAEIIIAGDTDKSGVGKIKGDAAAAAVGGRAVYPKSGDWNDVHVREGLGPIKKAITANVPDLTFSVADLEGTVAPDRKWIVEDMIPDRQVTLFSGDGGTGKSLLAMQLSVAVSLRENRPLQTWLGRPVIHGTALYIGAEDEQDEMHRRLADIIAAEKCSFNDLVGLRICSLAGEDALLAKESPANGPLSPSPLYGRIEAEMDKFHPKIVILDTLADMYPASENDRAKVRQFVGMLKKLALTYDCAIMLLAHPSKSGMESGRGDSGSTAWNGSVRSRLYLTHEKDADGQMDPDGRTLTNMKNNYGPLGASSKLRWDNGVFVVKAGDTPLDRKAATSKAERVFMRLLHEYTEQGRNLNSSSGANYAPKQFEGHRDSEGIRKVMFRKAMDNLFSDKKIVNETHGRSTRIVEVLL